MLAYIFFQFPFIQLDLWNDEIYTLKHFTFVSPLQTVTNYPVPNNHVFFNLINHFYLLMIGEKDVYTLMDHPWILRVLTFIYAAGTVFFTFKCADKMIGRNAAILSIIFICTTIPFYNFAVEIRGYCLSSFLLTVIAFVLFRYFETPKKQLLLILAVTTAAAIYTIPLNLYSIASVVVFLVAAFFFSLLMKSQPPENSRQVYPYKKYFPLLLVLTTGVLLALLFYAPVFHEVFFNEYVIPDPSFTFEKWFILLKKIFIAFFSYRYWLIPLMLAGLFSNLYRLIILKNTKGFVFFFFLVLMVFFPFIVSFLRKDAPPDRTFVNLIPFFSMLMAWMVNGFFNLIADKKFMHLFQAIVAVFCFTILSFQMKAVNDHLLNDILTSKRSHDIYNNYYLAHYHPLSVVKKFKQFVYTDSSFVVIRDAEPYDLPEYLNKFSIPVHDFYLLDEFLAAGKKVFLFSRHPNEITSDVFQHQHNCNVKLISEGVSYHNLFELLHKK